MSAYKIAKSFIVKPKSLSISFSFASSNDKPKTYKSFTQTFESLEEMKVFISQIITDYAHYKLIFLPICKSPIFFYIQEIEFNHNKKFGTHFGSLELLKDEEAFQQRLDMLIEEVWQALLTKKPINNELVIMDWKDEYYGNKIYLSNIYRKGSNYRYRFKLEETKISRLYYYIAFNDILSIPASNNILSMPIDCCDINHQ